MQKLALCQISGKIKADERWICGYAGSLQTEDTHEAFEWSIRFFLE